MGRGWLHLNSLEEFFAELKGFIKRHYGDHSGQDFGSFVEPKELI
jgi:hypothetical protein